MQSYRWIKFNYLSYYWAGCIVFYHMTVFCTVDQHDKKKIAYHVNFGVNSFKGVFVFY